MAIKISNNAVSRIAANIAPEAVTISLVPGGGALFPALSPGDWFPATLIMESGLHEIIKVTARSSDVLTVVRGQETTIARGFNAGDRLELRLTASMFQTLKDEMFVELALQGAQLANLLPPGTGPLPWSRPIEPAGWTWADGHALLSSASNDPLRNAYIADGFPFGSDGLGNPRVPDMRGRVAAGKDDLGGSLAGRLSATGGIVGTTLGAAGGAQTQTLTADQMPYHGHGASSGGGGNHAHTGSSDTQAAHSHSASSGNAGTHSHTLSTNSTDSGGGGSFGNISPNAGGGATTSVAPNHAHSVTVNAAGAHAHALTINAVGDHTHAIAVTPAGGNAAHPILQPTLITAYIVKL